MKKNFNRILCVVLLAGMLPLYLFAQYTEKDIYAYIDQYKDVAIQKMVEHRIPASITIAQGIFESACGKSHLAVDGNNHFGIKCHTDWTGDTILIDDDELQECFRKYETVAESFNDHSLFLKNRKRYANLFALDILDYPGWARTLKEDGYATNPKYADQLISLIQRYNLARLDTLCVQGASPADFACVTKKQEPTPQKPKTQDTPAKKQETKAPGSMKVFTAIGNDYPAGSSPFSYRKVFENNRTYFIIAKKGDTYETIAGDVQVAAASLRKFNDAPNGSQPVENEIVYIESKAKTNTARVHIVQSGETLRYISQRYGVQLEYLFKYNNLNENSIIHPGDQILLRH